MNRITTHKLLAILLSLIMVLGVMPMSVFAVDSPIIVGNSVYRTSATAGTVKLMSNTNGTAYYRITDSATAPSTEELSAWTNAGEVTANTTKSIELAGLTAGAKYVHIVVQSDDVLSNVLTVSMPQNYCYHEDFEAYPENTYVTQSGSPLAPISQQYGGSGNANQKVSSASGNNFFSLTSSGTASVQRINLPSNYRDGARRLVLKGKVMPLSEGPTWHEAAMFGIGDRKSGVLFIGGKICYADKSDINNITYNFNQWYEIELDINLMTNKYDIKVDGTTIASDVTYNDSEKYVNMFAGHGTTAYFDDISLMISEHIYDKTTVQDETTLVSAGTCKDNAVYKYTCECGAIGTATYEKPGSKDPDNHTSDEYEYTDNGDGATHTKKYMCCKAVADDKQDHDFEGNVCKLCKYDKTQIIDTGTTVSGTVKAFGSETGSTYIELYKDGADTASYEDIVTGNSGNYSITGVAAGTYTMRVSKLNHVTREYTVTVSGSETVTQNVEICLLGDVNGDGKITTMDYTKTNSHARGIILMTGYELQCADVVGDDGKATTMDATRINAHAKGTNLLW